MNLRSYPYSPFKTGNDFNQCFLSYDDLDGANCQTVLPDRMTQREAAVEAVKKIGLRQIKEVDMSIFGSME